MSEPTYCRAIIGMGPGVRGVCICRRTPGHEGEHRLEPDDASPREVNHGPLSGGGFWAGFCSNEDCNVLGCPGDCGVLPTAPDPGTVLAGLVEELRALAGEFEETPTLAVEARGIHHARRLVEAAQRVVTSGARAAGGESLGGPCSECGAGQGEPCRPGCEWAEELARMHRDSVARQSRPLRPGAASAVAPSTPTAPGVAALLAECSRRQKLYDEQWISIKQVQRLLAPGGADGEGEGT